MLNEKRVGEDVLYERPVVGAREAAEDGPQGVGPELRRHRVDAHRGGAVSSSRTEIQARPSLESLRRMLT